jgi:hypothetical protein
MTESSFDTRREGSRKAGEGDRTGFGASESERGLLGEHLKGVFEDLGVRPPSSLRSICWVKVDLPGEGEAR